MTGQLVVSGFHFSIVGLDEVSAGLSADDGRFRDTVLAVIRAD